MRSDWLDDLTVDRWIIPRTLACVDFNKFHYITIYQDTNHAQYLLWNFWSKFRDDPQNDGENILSFEQDYPDKVVLLEQKLLFNKDYLKSSQIKSFTAT